jgi:DnaJ-class molecular chaperone
VLGDFYSDLELAQGEDSSEQDIKKAFRKMSRLYHPDVNPSDDAKEKYLSVNKAYEVLSDQKKRKIYDMKGDDGLKQLEESEKRGNQMDPFAALFGRQQDRTKGQDVHMQIKVSLEDVYNGASHRVTLQKQKLCRKCKGSGAASKEDLQPCNRCQGKGVIIQKIQLAPGFVQQVQNPCPECGGTGKKVKRKCPECKGKKVLRGESTLEVLVEKGMPEGHELKFEMEADESPDMLPGDVIFQVHTHPHSVFRREGNDLHMTMTISLLEALVGFEKKILHLDGHEVDIVRELVTPHGFKKTMKNEGMLLHNTPSEAGNLIITFEVDYPKSITEEQAKGFRQLLGR